MIGLPRVPKQTRNDGKGAFRWPVVLRKYMAIAVCGVLSLEEQIAIATGAMNFPTRRKALNEAYARIRTAVHQYLRKKGTPKKWIPVADAIRKAARRWAHSWLVHGHVFDQPPHRKGYKMTEARLSILRRLRVLVLRGYTAVAGTFPYSCLKHAAVLDPEVGRLILRLRVTPTVAWQMMRQEFPDLYKGKMLAKKSRDTVSVQVSTALHPHTYAEMSVWLSVRVPPHDHADGVQECALSVDARRAVDWPSCYYELRKRKVRLPDGTQVEIEERQYHLCAADKNGEQLFSWQCPYYWHWILGYIQLHMDAFTFDAKELFLKKNKVIKSRGAPQTPVANQATNASVGSMPKFLVFMSAHWLLGLQAYFLYTACSGGRVWSFKDFEYWYQKRPLAYLQHLAGADYYNVPAAARKLPAGSRTAPFDPAHFLVRTLHQQTLAELLLPLLQWQILLLSPCKHNHWDAMLHAECSFLLVTLSCPTATVVWPIHLDCMPYSYSRAHHQVCVHVCSSHKASACCITTLVAQ